MICRSLQVCAGKITTKTKGNPSAPTSLGQIEATVDTRCERHSTAQSIISVGGQLGDKPHRSSLGEGYGESSPEIEIVVLPTCLYISSLNLSMCDLKERPATNELIFD